MLTEKQMKALPKGEYFNYDLSRVNRRHCLPKGFKHPESFGYNRKEESVPITVTGLKNRQQRRKGVKL